MIQIKVWSTTQFSNFSVFDIIGISKNSRISVKDDTLRIFELATPNSGFPGGNFLRRQKYRKDPKDYSLPCITYRDLAVGSILEINRYKLEMYTCDSATEALEKELDYD